VYAGADAARFERAIVRWHGRYCVEHRPSADEAQLVLAALRALPGAARIAAAGSLLHLFETRGMRGALRHLNRWIGPDNGR
jgi:hypothetical protein